MACLGSASVGWDNKNMSDHQKPEGRVLVEKEHIIMSHKQNPEGKTHPSHSSGCEMLWVEQLNSSWF